MDWLKGSKRPHQAYGPQFVDPCSIMLYQRYIQEGKTSLKSESTFVSLAEEAANNKLYPQDYIMCKNDVQGHKYKYTNTMISKYYQAF